MTIRDVTQDIDPASEPEDRRPANPGTSRIIPQADENSESLHRA